MLINASTIVEYIGEEGRGVKKRIRRCIYCGAPLPEGRWRPYCPECGAKRVADAILQLQSRSGPLYEKWRANLLRGLARSKVEG
jgi:predicted amidophosphoribosyltransferase